MARIDGRQIKNNILENYDVVIIGSGPAGAASAAILTEAGLRIAIIEEGAWINTTSNKGNIPTDIGNSFKHFYRDNGTSVLLGSPPTPFLQGKAVGGSSTINGAISWRLPERIYQEWLQKDAAFEKQLPWDAISQSMDEVEKRLNIAPTPDAQAGPRNLLMTKGADALGLEHRAISRNVTNCKSSGLCLHYCRNNAKQSMDVTYLLDAEKHGADIYSSCKVLRIQHRQNKIEKIIAQSESKQNIELNCKALVLAASTVQSPQLLLASGIKHGPVGQNFQCHPGISVSGRFPEEVHNWHDATQGHEVIGLCHEGIKFETTAMDISVLGMRLPGAGKMFMENLQASKRHVDWAAAIRSTSLGTVSNVFGNAFVRWSPHQEDILRFRKGASILATMLFHAGAESVYLGIHGWNKPITSIEEAENFSQAGPTKAKDYSFAVTHMFGTCRMGSDKHENVVGLDFQHHKIKGLYISDSSIFPSNTGVNPQTSILALSRLCAQSLLSNF